MDRFRSKTVFSFGRRRFSFALRRCSVSRLILSASEPTRSTRLKSFGTPALPPARAAAVPALLRRTGLKRTRTRALPRPPRESATALPMAPLACATQPRQVSLASPPMRRRSGGRRHDLFRASSLLARVLRPGCAFGLTPPEWSHPQPLILGGRRRGTQCNMVRCTATYFDALRTNFCSPRSDWGSPPGDEERARSGGMLLIH